MGIMAKSETIERCIQAAEEAGCPPDQVRQFLSCAYVPYPWQWKFHAAARAADYHDGPIDIGAGGARGPGKSHAVLSQVALDDCQRVDNLKGLFLRQTGVSAQESFDDLIEKTVRHRVPMIKTKNSLRFPNGSRILLGGFKDEGDIDKYIGIEYDFIIVEELNQLTEDKYSKLRGSLRTSKPNWRPRMYTSFNPGGVGHAFVKSRYVIPFREDKQKETRFVPSTYKENPALNVEYQEYLETLGGNLGKAWREGDWDLFEGMYFTEWRREKHVVQPFEVPQSWFRYRSIDPSGREGVTSCHWYAVDSNGRIYCYKEYYCTGRDIDEHAKAIYEMSCNEEGVPEKYQHTLMDSSAWQKGGFGETATEIFEREGVTGLMKPHKERVIGWNAVHRLLRWQDENGIYTAPKLQIFSTCYNLIRTLPLAQHDEDHPEDVEEDQRSSFTDHDGRQGTEHLDALDDLRYFARSIREDHSPKPQNIVERKLDGFNKQKQGRGFDYQYKR